jgi:hypothetical protein
MVCDVATAAGLAHLDAARGQELGRRDQVRPRNLGLDAERDDVRMFEEQEKIGYATGPPFLDERALHLMRDRIRDDAEPPNFQLTHPYMVA